ncbi:aquaporin-9-like isoform X2 [Myotis lucifugus]|uniref:aquaporin-9-like isoform X2 n=1 Tax=Myotis lucifugus TaxID=59463 RepID=UPI000CCC0A64|nr:aquaporin-9-like isoform X2 [Myotis lucifugus]
MQSEVQRRRFRQRLMLKSSLAKEILSEFLGTCIMIVLGCGSIAQSVLSRGTYGGTLAVNVGFSVAVGMAVYVAGGVSGGHINPAVSFAMCLFGRMKWFKFPFYVGAQLFGAFTGSAILFGVYYDSFMSFADGELYIVGENATAQIFATYPAPYLSLVNGFADQVVWKLLLVDSYRGPYGWCCHGRPHLRSFH